MIKFKQKIYTQWDQTDQLKQMKDADILAEKKKSNTSLNVSTGIFFPSGLQSDMQ